MDRVESSPPAEDAWRRRPGRREAHPGLRVRLCGEEPHLRTSPAPDASSAATELPDASARRIWPASSRPSRRCEVPAILGGRSLEPNPARDANWLPRPRPSRLRERLRGLASHGQLSPARLRRGGRAAPATPVGRTAPPSSFPSSIAPRLAGSRCPRNVLSCRRASESARAERRRVLSSPIYPYGDPRLEHGMSTCGPSERPWTGLSFVEQLRMVSVGAGLRHHRLWTPQCRRLVGRRGRGPAPAGPRDCLR